MKRLLGSNNVKTFAEFLHTFKYPLYYFRNLFDCNELLTYTGKLCDNNRISNIEDLELYCENIPRTMNEVINIVFTHLDKIDIIKDISSYFGCTITANKDEFINDIKDFLIDNCLKLYIAFVALKDDQDVPIFFVSEAYNPNDFIKIDDEVGDTVRSLISPINFSQDRTSPLVIIDDNILLGTSKQHHETLINNFKAKKYKELTGEDMPEEEELAVAYSRGYEQVQKYFKSATVGVGSSFSENQVALLEYVTGSLPDEVIEGKVIENSGNINAVKSVLKSHGFKKVYINNNVAWSGKIYKRIAKPTRLMKKI